MGVIPACMVVKTWSKIKRTSVSTIWCPLSSMNHISSLNLRKLQFLIKKEGIASMMLRH